MELIEAQYDGGRTDKKECDFCMEEPDDGILIEKPMSTIVRGRIIKSRRYGAIYLCTECLMSDIDDTHYMED